jgi:DNA-binding Xre family transcriptional regulator
MKLKAIVIMAIKGNSDLRKNIREALGVSNSTMTRLLQENDDDLTKAAALEIIREELKMEDSEILERTPTEVQS